MPATAPGARSFRHHTAGDGELVAPARSSPPQRERSAPGAEYGQGRLHPAGPCACRRNSRPVRPPCGIHCASGSYLRHTWWLHDSCVCGCRQVGPRAGGAPR
eukprot:scaffold1146_cov399-Prasinococcus_capsulatus_cf.AAC.81